MFSVNQRFKNTSKTRKPQWYVCKVLIGLSCTIYSGSSLADTNHGQMAVSLAVIGGATAVNTGRNFGSSHYTWGAAEISLLKAGYKKPSNNPFEQPISKNESLATPSATLSPPTYYRAATTSERPRNSSVTAM